MCALCAKSRHHSNLKKKKNSCIKIYIKKKGIDEKLEPSSKKKKKNSCINFFKEGTDENLEPSDTRTTRQIKAREHMSPKNITIATTNNTLIKQRGVSHCDVTIYIKKSLSYDTKKNYGNSNISP
jgi:hypothetical protein